jgi:subtilisin family serine protease
MNAIRVLLLLALMLAAGQAAAIDQEEENTAIEGSRASRMILVTFADRTIKRVAADAAGNHYRQRGYYRKSTWSTRISGQISETYRLKQINEWPVSELGVYCVVYEVGGNKQVEKVLETLRRDERIDVAQPMHLFQTMAAHYSDPYFRLQNNLQTLQIEAAHRRATGRGVKIAVVDTGVDLEHPDLEGQVTEHRDFTATEPGRFSADLHGTAVAGAIGALADNRRGIVGVAPGAELLAFKACWQAKPGTLEAACNSLTLALALNTAIRMKPHILNLSLSGPPDPLLRQLIEHALANGIIVVAAAADQAGATGGFPASMEGVIAAYSPAQTGHNALNGSGRLLLAAPGVEILTTFPRDSYNFISGSSISAAQISGVIALLLEMRPNLTGADIAALLGKSAVSAQNGENRATVMINAEAAVEQLAGARYAASEKNIFWFEP